MTAWVATASADHVRRGRTDGFMQVCHGKAAPLRRIHPGDTVIYYSSVEVMGGHDRCQRFTALGTVRGDKPYAFDTGSGFVPFRHDVDWRSDAREVAIQPLLDRLSFTAGRRNWGYAFRFGILKITDADADLIAGAMTGKSRSDDGPKTLSRIVPMGEIDEIQSALPDLFTGRS